LGPAKLRLRTSNMNIKSTSDDGLQSYCRAASHTASKLKER